MGGYRKSCLVAFFSFLNVVKSIFDVTRKPVDFYFQSAKFYQKKYGFNIQGENPFFRFLTKWLILEFLMILST